MRTGFVDPIFSAGVFIAMRSAELAAEAIIHAFRRQDFSASALRPYAARLHRGVAPFLAMIQRFYEPRVSRSVLQSDPSSAPVSRCAVGAQWGGF